jgi:hypothetical protein
MDPEGAAGHHREGHMSLKVENRVQDSCQKDRSLMWYSGRSLITTAINTTIKNGP